MKELKIFEQNKHTKYYIDNLGNTYSQAGAKYNMPYSTVAHFIKGSRGVKNEN